MTQIRQKIIKIGKGRFRVLWNEQRYEGQAIILDFNPILQQFNLDNLYRDYCLLHWQSRPFGLRRWGIYHRTEDEYYGVDYDKVSFSNIEGMQLLQVDETRLISPPSATVLLPNHKINRNGSLIKCEVIDGMVKDNRDITDSPNSDNSMVDAETIRGDKGGEEGVS
jgi:hypothetical protein